MYVDHWMLEKTHWWFVGRRIIVESLMESLGGIVKKIRITDIGSGGGGMLSLLQRFGTVSSFEPDKLSAERLSERFGSVVTVVNDDVFSDHFSKTQPDAVTLFDVLEHITDDVRVLRRIFDVLPSGGRLICTVPAFPSLWSSHDELSHHVRRYTRAQLVQKMCDTGFEIERVSFFNTFLFVPIACIRWISRHVGRNESDFHLPRFGLNTLFTKLFAFEAALLSVCNLQFGVSLFLVARKK